MLDGLEITEVKLSKAKNEISEYRFDSEYYLKEYLETEERLRKLNCHNFEDFSKDIRKGIFDLPPTYYKTEGVPLVRTKAIKNPLIDFEDMVYISEGTNRDNPKTSLAPFDIVFTKIGAYIGDVAILPPTHKNFNISQNVAGCRIKDKAISPYLLFYLLSISGRNQIIRSQMLSGQGKLDLSQIKKLKVVLPSDNQKELYNKITSVLFRLDKNSQENYQAAVDQLLSTIKLSDCDLTGKKYSVKSMTESFQVTGRLDAEFYQDKFDVLYSHLFNQSKVKTIADISTVNCRGFQPEYIEDGKLSVINSRHILEDHLDYDNFEKTSPNYWKLKPKAQVFRGDILIYTTGANIGRTNVYYSDEKALASNHVNILRIKGENPYYVGFVLNTFVGRMQTDKFSSGSAQAELYPKDIDQFLIPFVEEKIQNKICKNVEQTLELRKKSRKLLDIAKEGVEKAIEVNEAFATDWIENELKELGVELSPEE